MIPVSNQIKASKAAAAKQAAEAAAKEYIRLEKERVGKLVEEIPYIDEDPILIDDYARVVTEVPVRTGLPAGAYMPRNADGRLLPMTLRGAEAWHGADGIDHKPVPQDVWGLRGVLNGLAGMPRGNRIAVGKALRDEERDDAFPGVTADGRVDRNRFRKLVEAGCTSRRIPGRAGDTITRQEQTAISHIASYADRASNAAVIAGVKRSIRARAGAGAGSTGPAASDPALELLLRVEPEPPRRDLAAPAAGDAGQPPPSGRVAAASTAAQVLARKAAGGGGPTSEGHYEESGVGILLESVDHHVKIGEVNANAGTAERDKVEMVDGGVRVERRVCIRRILPGTAAARSSPQTICVGDELLAVDGCEVTYQHLHVINAMLLGSPGTAVSLSFRRSLSAAARGNVDGMAGGREGSDSDESSDLEGPSDLFHYYQVRLMRGSSAYLALLDASESLLAERKTLLAKLAQSESRVQEQKKEVMIAMDQLGAKDVALNQQTSVAQQLYFDKVSNGAVTAGEIIYGGRVRSLEAAVEALEATVRGQERELDAARTENAQLRRKLQADGETIAFMRERSESIRRRFESALRATQDEEDPRNMDSAGSVLRSLEAAHGAFMRNMHASFSPALALHIPAPADAIVPPMGGVLHAAPAAAAVSPSFVGGGGGRGPGGGDQRRPDDAAAAVSTTSQPRLGRSNPGPGEDSSFASTPRQFYSEDNSTPSHVAFSGATTPRSQHPQSADAGSRSPNARSGHQGLKGHGGGAEGEEPRPAVSRVERAEQDAMDLQLRAEGRERGAATSLQHAELYKQTYTDWEERLARLLDGPPPGGSGAAATSGPAAQAAQATSAAAVLASQGRKDSQAARDWTLEGTLSFMTRKMPTQAQANGTGGPGPPL